MNKPKKIIGICGSMTSAGKSSSQFLLEIALEAAREEGAQVELIRLADMNIKECLGCGNCLSNRKCPLHEDLEDEHHILYKKCLEADGFIFSSPVYALALPSIWKKWIDRCDVNDETDLDYDYYNYDTVERVKGKAFRGKVAAQIAVAAGLGHELALAQLMPAFTAVKLTIVANVGLSLIEYDSEPGIKNESWSKDIKDAKFAIDMARAVGKRVFETIGYSAFSIKPIDYKGNKKQWVEILNIPIEDVNGNEIRLSSYEQNILILIASSQKTFMEGAAWKKELINKYSEESDIKILNIACIGQLPHFITHEFVLGNIKRTMTDGDMLIDWELKFSSMCNINVEDKPQIIIYDRKNEEMLFSECMNYSDDNLYDIASIIEGSIR